MLVLDPQLPPKTWETRRGTGSCIARRRTKLDAETFLAIIEDPKAETLAVGERVHLDLVGVMNQPGLRTDAQRRAEEAAGIDRKKRRRRPRGDASDYPAGFGEKGGDRPRFTLPWDEPDPPEGTPGPGGAAS